MRRFTAQLARWGSRPAAEMEDAAARLAEESTAASTLRAYEQHPSVQALQIERTRERVERVLLIAMTCGLLYTTVNVQAFVAGDSAGVGWWVAWLVEPFITAGVLALLRIDQVARRNHVVPGSWVRLTRWAAFAATYTFNTWEAWFGPSFSPREIVLHSVIPVLVFFFAEALTDGRDALTAAVYRVAGPTPELDPVTVPLPVQTPADQGPDPERTPEDEGSDHDETTDEEPPAKVIDAVPDEVLLARLRAWVAEEGSMPSREKVRTAFGVGTKRAQRLRERVQAEETTREEAVR